MNYNLLVMRLLMYSLLIFIIVLILSVHLGIFEQNTTENETFFGEYYEWDLKYSNISSTNMHPSSRIGMVLDSNDNPHVIFLNYNNTESLLKYAFWNGNIWDIQIIDNHTTKAINNKNIAIDGSDNIHICYYDEINQDLKYGIYTDYNWHIETVDSIGDVGKGCSINVDGKNNPHIVYYDFSKDNLKYIYKKDNNWNIESIIKDVCIDNYNYLFASSSINFDNTGKINIAYYSKSNNYTDKGLKFTYLNGGEWVIQNVSYLNRPRCFVLFDNEDNPLIIFYSATYAKLHFMIQENDSWNFITDIYIGSNAIFSSFVVDENNNIHFCYCNPLDQIVWENDVLKYAIWNGKDWSITKITDYWSNTESVDLAFDSDNKPSIVYIKDGKMYYATLKK